MAALASGLTIFSQYDPPFGDRDLAPLLWTEGKSLSPLMYKRILALLLLFFAFLEPRLLNLFHDMRTDERARAEPLGFGCSRQPFSVFRIDPEGKLRV